MSTRVLHFHKFEGLASDLKTVPADMVKKRCLRTGDGTSPYAKLKPDDTDSPSNNNNVEEERDTEHFWGWGECVKLSRRLTD